MASVKASRSSNASSDSMRYWLPVLVAIRLAISYLQPFDDLVHDHQLSSPLTSYRNLQEGIYLYQNNVDPYSGGVFRHSPLYLSLFSTIIPKSAGISAVLWTLCDAVGAYSLVEIWRARQGLGKTESSRDALVAASYLFNPYLFLPSLALSTSSFENALALVVMMFACKRQASRALFGMAFLLHISLSSLLLLAPVILLLLSDPNSHLASPRAFSGDIKKLPLLLVEFFAYFGTLTGVACAITGGLTWIPQTWGASLTLPDLTPNTGLWWYFFTEMFDHFRPFFLMVFSVHLLIYIAPMCIKFQYDPLYACFLLFGILGTFKAYPTLSDPGLFLTMHAIFPEIYPYMRYPIVTALLHLHASLLLPLFHHLWLAQGTGNANFFYASTLVFACANGAAVIDAIWAGLRIAVGEEKEGWAALPSTQEIVLSSSLVGSCTGYRPHDLIPLRIMEFQPAPALTNFSFNVIGKEPDLLKRLSAPNPDHSNQYEDEDQTMDEDFSPSSTASDDAVTEKIVRPLSRPTLLQALSRPEGVNVVSMGGTAINATSVDQANGHITLSGQSHAANVDVVSTSNRPSSSSSGHNVPIPTVKPSSTASTPHSRSHPSHAKSSATTRSDTPDRALSPYTLQYPGDESDARSSSPLKHAIKMESTNSGSIAATRSQSERVPSPAPLGESEPSTSSPSLASLRELHARITTSLSSFQPLTASLLSPNGQGMHDNDIGGILSSALDLTGRAQHLSQTSVAAADDCLRAVQKALESAQGSRSAARDAHERVEQAIRAVKSREAAWSQKFDDLKHQFAELEDCIVAIEQEHVHRASAEDVDMADSESASKDDSEDEHRLQEEEELRLRSLKESEEAARLERLAVEQKILEARQERDRLRREKEEAERRKKEAEEKERLRRAEERERLRKEAEAERQRKLAEERERREVEQRENEERERREKEVRERLKMAEEEQRAKVEEHRREEELRLAAERQAEGERRRQAEEQRARELDEERKLREELRLRKGQDRQRTAEQTTLRQWSQEENRGPTTQQSSAGGTISASEEPTHPPIATITTSKSPSLPPPPYSEPVSPPVLRKLPAQKQSKPPSTSNPVAQQTLAPLSSSQPKLSRKEKKKQKREAASRVVSGDVRLGPGPVDEGMVRAAALGIRPSNSNGTISLPASLPKRPDLSISTASQNKGKAKVPGPADTNRPTDTQNTIRQHPTQMSPIEQDNASTTSSEGPALHSLDPTNTGNLPMDLKEYSPVLPECQMMNVRHLVPAAPPAISSPVFDVEMFVKKEEGDEFKPVVTDELALGNQGRRSSTSSFTPNQESKRLPSEPAAIGARAHRRAPLEPQPNMSSAPSHSIATQQPPGLPTAPNPRVNGGWHNFQSIMPLPEPDVAPVVDEPEYAVNSYIRGDHYSPSPPRHGPSPGPSSGHHYRRSPTPPRYERAVYDPTPQRRERELSPMRRTPSPVYPSAGRKRFREYDQEDDHDYGHRQGWRPEDRPSYERSDYASGSQDRARTPPLPQNPPRHYSPPDSPPNLQSRIHTKRQRDYSPPTYAGHQQAPPMPPIPTQPRGNNHSRLHNQQSRNNSRNPPADWATATPMAPSNNSSSGLALLSRMHDTANAPVQTQRNNHNPRGNFNTGKGRNRKLTGGGGGNGGPRQNLAQRIDKEPRTLAARLQQSPR
ncbi:hypothetical protein VNI00_009900 [Paramarasmius palmivorus]|uniref:Uncharacterized protein n=1 Tax=Paramarasmius palmivorus TaxID=297713 RepID=A0AAW0CMN2_9AGAR